MGAGLYFLPGLEIRWTAREPPGKQGGFAICAGYVGLPLSRYIFLGHIVVICTCTQK